VNENPVLRVFELIVDKELPREKLAEAVAEYRKFRHLVPEERAVEVDDYLKQHGF